MNVDTAHIRILLADDHEVVRQGLRALIETHEGWEVCGEAADGRSAVELVDSLEPDIVILDLSMPLLNGLEAARRILRKNPQMPIMILSMHESEQLVREILKAGIRGYVLKSDASRELLDGIEALTRGESFFHSTVAVRVQKTKTVKGRKRRGSDRPPGPLTPREREIVQLLAEGQSNKGVAEGLNISVKTAETHRARVMRKLEIGSVAELVRYAIRNGIISL